MLETQVQIFWKCLHLWGFICYCDALCMFTLGSIVYLELIFKYLCYRLVVKMKIFLIFKLMLTKTPASPTV